MDEHEYMERLPLPATYEEAIEALKTTRQHLADMRTYRDTARHAQEELQGVVTAQEAKITALEQEGSNASLRWNELVEKQAAEIERLRKLVDMVIRLSPLSEPELGSARINYADQENYKTAYNLWLIGKDARGQ
ncbi:MAG: hypothetical protein K8L91_01540 [Anaerolineae bacterium]|nr:hypothetical protein [Anaerolineae bacterium]